MFRRLLLLALAALAPATAFGSYECSRYQGYPQLCQSDFNCYWDAAYNVCEDRVPGGGGIPCYNFGGDPVGCNQQPGCYWDTYGEICAQRLGPGPGPIPVPGPTGPLTLTGSCVSNGFPATCPVNGRIVGARLVQQLPGGVCIYGRTWSFDARAVYVSNGCRAYFTVTYYPY